MRVSILGCFLILSFLTACSGTIKTRPLSPGEDVTGSLNGVVYYPLGQFYEITATTITKDGKGNTTHWYSDGTCIPVLQSRLVTRPDYEHPRLIFYDHGILEAYKLNATLAADGSLQGAGSESAPERGETLSNLASAALNGAKTGGFVAAAQEKPSAKKPACNEGPVAVQYLPAIKGKTGLE